MIEKRRELREKKIAFWQARMDEAKPLTRAERLATAQKQFHEAQLERLEQPKETP